MANSSYNPYDKIKEIYDAKVAYNTATTDAERQKQNTIATNARKTLEAYGYGDVASQLSATGADATATRKILEQYSPNKVTDTNTKYSNNTLKTGINNDAYNNRVASGSTKNDIYFNTVQNDHTNVNGKYTDLYNYANQDITQTDEYKSTFANIMPQYNLKAMQGRESELASGSSSNGGNIDSFASANALRQQASITAKGQALAHQMGLEAANSRISNVNNILSNLGVYNSSVYSAMSDSINNDRNLANDVANNEQTALNNQAAREEVYSNISGTVGDTVTKAQNSNVWNSDGSLKNDAQNFQADIEALEKTLYSTTNESEKAKIKEQLRVLELARNQKIDEQGLTYGKTYKYQTNPQTVADKQFDKTMDYNYKALDTEKEVNTANIQAEQQANNQKNATDLLVAQIKAGTNGGVVVDENGNVVVSDETQQPQEAEEIIDFTDDFETDSSGKLVVPENIDTTTDRYKNSGIDEYGKAFVKKILEFAHQNAGKLTKDELVNYVVGTSKINQINVNQLEKVLAYLGINNSIIDEYGIENNTGIFKVDGNWYNPFDGYKSGLKMKGKN